MGPSTRHVTCNSPSLGAAVTPREGPIKLELPRGRWSSQGFLCMRFRVTDWSMCFGVRRHLAGNLNGAWEGRMVPGKAEWCPGRLNVATEG
jgi:hypothetical protein